LGAGLQRARAVVRSASARGIMKLQGMLATADKV
jgi:hypothetical protein